MAEIPDNIKADLAIIPVRWIDEVLEHALQYQPSPLKGEKKTKAKEKAKQEDIDPASDEKHINTH